MHSLFFFLLLVLALCLDAFVASFSYGASRIRIPLSSALVLDIICTATPSEEPVLPNDRELLEGKCIIAIGSYTPQMREIPDVIWDLVDNVYIELPYACEESGDLSQPLAEGRLTMDRVVLMDKFLASGADEDEIAKKTTYFKSVGMGLFDVCVAQKLLEKAKER